MSIFKMEEMTWNEIEKLDKEKSIIFVALSPIEEHGPHLPLGTDYISANDILKAVVDNLEIKNSEYNYVIHPSFPIGYNECVMDFPGTIFYRSKTLENLLVDFGESINRIGFKKIIIVNHHLDLGHIKSIENAKDRLFKECSLKILEVAGRIIYSESKDKNSDEDVENEIHADIRETSFMLFKHPNLVRKCYKNLKPVCLNIEEFFKNRKRYWSESGVTEGYIGSPAKASRERGEMQLKDSVKMITKLIDNFIKDDYIPELSEETKHAMNHIILR